MGVCPESIKTLLQQYWYIERARGLLILKLLMSSYANDVLASACVGA